MRKNIQFGVQGQIILIFTIFLFILPDEIIGQETFTNPVMEGADPHVVYYDGYYYMLVTRGDRVGIKRSADLNRIHEYNEIVVWKFENTPVGGHVWAPEMHFIDGKWYIYTCGQNTGNPGNPSAVDYIQENQQMVLLESQSGDPLGPYKFKSWLLEGTGAIDETVFTHNDGKNYIIWSQFNEPGQSQTQCLYIAELINPWTIGETRIKISCPELDWEKNGWPVNEGPAVLQRNGKTFIIYSGSGYTTPEYALGYLMNTTGDLLDKNAWHKTGPVFSQNPSGGVYSTGHNCFTKSPDGSEDWIVYHARLSPDGNTSRYVFLQKFYWKGDTPFFGTPVPVRDEIRVPEKNRGQIIGISPFSEPSGFLSVDDVSNDLVLSEPMNASDFQRKATFMLVPGLAVDSCLSIESKGYPGYYLLNREGELRLVPFDATDDYRISATFIERRAWSGSDNGYISLESYGNPENFLIVMDKEFQFEVITNDSSGNQFEKSSWKFEDYFNVYDCYGDYHGKAFIDSCGMFIPIL